MQEVLAASSPTDWRPLDPNNTLYVELPPGRVVIGHAPRHLDRNVALVGRVMKGMELLSSLPRGSAAMGFYAKSEAPTPIKSVRIAADLPESQRSPLEVIRTGSPTFTALIESRRNRPEDFFKVQAGHIDLCNVPIAVRERPPHSS
jgi:peptidylprolyl isomerase